jgi:hypothetical protein
MSRDDPTGKRALFTPAAAGLSRPGARQRNGKAALFSSGPAQPGTVLVECANCRARSRLTLMEVGLRMLPLWLWCPLHTHSLWMRCPACEQRQWCRVGWSD